MIRLEAIAIRLEAIALRSEAIPNKLEAIAIRLEAMYILRTYSHVFHIGHVFITQMDRLRWSSLRTRCQNIRASHAWLFYIVRTQR